MEDKNWIEGTSFSSLVLVTRVEKCVLTDFLKKMRRTSTEANSSHENMISVKRLQVNLKCVTGFFDCTWQPTEIR